MTKSLISQHADSNVPDICSPNADAEAELIPTFSDSMIISCPELTVVDVEHTLTRETCFICVQNIMYNEIIRSVLMSQGTVVWKQTWAPWVFFEYCRFGQSKFSRDFTWFSPQLSFHIFNFVIFLCWCLHSLLASCIHVCRSYYAFYFSRRSSNGRNILASTTRAM
jgi:hypothetical protein